MSKVGQPCQGFQVSCPSCHATLKLEPDQILLAERPVPPATYTIWCHACDTVGVKRADALAAGLLRTAGVTPVTAASAHPEQPPSGPPLSYDDLLDLHLLLTTDEWLHAPSAAVRSANGDGSTSEAMPPTTAPQRNNKSRPA